MPTASPRLVHWFCPACSHPVSAVTRAALDAAITDHKTAAVVRTVKAAPGRVARPHSADD